MPPPPSPAPFPVGSRPVIDAFRWLWDAAAPEDKRFILSTVAGAGKLPDMLRDFDADKAAYFSTIEQIQVAKRGFEKALADSGVPVPARHTKSSFDAEVVRQAKRVLLEVNASTDAEFETLGESEADRILIAEKRLRQLLINALLQAIALELDEHLPAEIRVPSPVPRFLEEPAVRLAASLSVDLADERRSPSPRLSSLDPESPSVLTEPATPDDVVEVPDVPEEAASVARQLTEIFVAVDQELLVGHIDIPSLQALSSRELLLRLQAYLIENTVFLVEGSQVHIHAVSQMMMLRQFAANTTQAYIAWRCMDPQIDTVYWPMLTVAPHPLKAKNACFSTADTYDGGGDLLLEEAARLVRLQLAKCVLACTDMALLAEVRAELATRIVFYLAEIQRAHSDTVVSQDSPSCYPGTLTRLAQIFRVHPVYQALFPPPDDRMIIAEAFFAKLSRIFFSKCALLGTLDDKACYFDSLAGYLDSEHLSVLADSYLTFSDALRLSQWRIYREELQSAIKEGTSDDVFIDTFLNDLKTQGRITEVNRVSCRWVHYLLVSLVDSRETLAKLWYQLEPLFAPKEELDAAQRQGAAPLLPDYERLEMKRKNSEPDKEARLTAGRPVQRRRTRSPSPSAESLLDLL